VVPIDPNPEELHELARFAASPRPAVSERSTGAPNEALTSCYRLPTGRRSSRCGAAGERLPRRERAPYAECREHPRRPAIEMGEAQHSRARDLFLEALDRPPGERSAHLDRACGENADLRREVESLLSHHDPVSLFDKPVEGAPDLPVRTLAPESTASGRWRLGTLVASPARRASWVLAAAGALLGLGLWTHSRIEHALLQRHAIELETVLRAKVEALGVWIREQEGQLKLLAADPRVLDAARELLGTSHGRTREAATELWKRAPARQRLIQLGELFADKTQSRRWIGLTDDRGVIVFSPAETEIGRLVNAEGRRYLSRALDGETVFVRPYRMGDLIGDYTTGTMYTWVLTPCQGRAVEPAGS
jgi:hypothetical protein